MEQLEERLQNGDDAVTRNGEVVRKRVAARDLAVIAGIVADKAEQWRQWGAEGAGGSNVTPHEYLDVLETLERLRAELARRQEVEVEVTAVPVEQGPPLEPRS